MNLGKQNHSDNYRMRWSNKSINIKMIFKKLLFMLAFSGMLFMVSCKEEETEGCMDSGSYTYDPTATVDDGSCSYYYGGKEFGQIDVGSQVDLNNEYDIYIDGVFIGRSTYYFPSGLSCGNPQAVGGIFNAGTHTVKAIGNGGNEVREGSVYLDAQNCKVVLIETLLITDGGGGGSDKGNITFWVNQDLGCGNIYVTINSYGSGTISAYYSGNPGCGASDCAIFSNLEYGSYSYTATSDGGCTWSGNIIVDASCETMQLSIDGGGGGGDTGNVTFWTNQDLGCGNIYVTITSYGQGTIGAYYTGNPGCGASDCANFTNLSYGAYSYSAISDGGCTWNGNIQVDQSCEMMQLTLANRSTADEGVNSELINYRQ
jgi:hypothetical protein